MTEICGKCGGPLCYKRTIFAALGSLFCSKKCGARAFNDAKIQFDFDDVCDELKPSSIGIMPTYKYKITGKDRHGRVFKPIYTDTPRHFNIWSGTVWRVLPDGRVSKCYDIVN